MDSTDAGSSNGRVEARSVLRFAVESSGTKVLSNPSIIEGLCKDQLADFPRETSLIINAAKANVAVMLEQQIEGVGADTAVRLTAATLAHSRSIDPAGCIWVVSEFARCLGHQVSESLEPTASPTPPAAPALVAFGTNDAPTVFPTLPPDVGSPHVDAQIAVPSLLDVASGVEPTTTPPRPRVSLTRRVRWLTLVVVVSVGAYVGAAAATNLPPFSKSPAPVSRTALAYKSLSKEIPTAIRSNGSCSDHKNVKFGSATTVAEIICRPSDRVSLPFNYIGYYRFRSLAALNDAYSTWLTQFAKTTKDAGSCSFGSGQADTFVPCETSFVIGSGTATSGRIVEYMYKGVPDLSFTDDQALVIIDMENSQGAAMVAWWADHSSNWLAGN